MKPFLKVIAYMASIHLICSCSAYHMPPFATASNWQLRGNCAVSNQRNITVDFSGGDPMPLANAGNGSYDLNFISTANSWARYNPQLAAYITDILKTIPIPIDSVELIMADRFIILSTGITAQWSPDYVRRADGAWFVVQANPVESLVQPHDELWRNLLFNNRKRQITVIDRIIKDGHHLAIIYILQSEHKNSHLANCFHYDIIDPRNVQVVGTYLESLLSISVKAQQSNALSKPN